MIRFKYLQFLCETFHWTRAYLYIVSHKGHRFNAQQLVFVRIKFLLQEAIETAAVALV